MQRVNWAHPARDDLLTIDEREAAAGVAVRTLTATRVGYPIVGDVVQVLRVHHEREDWLLKP